MVHFHRTDAMFQLYVTKMPQKLGGGNKTN